MANTTILLHIKMNFILKYSNKSATSGFYIVFYIIVNLLTIHVYGYIHVWEDHLLSITLFDMLICASKRNRGSNIRGHVLLIY